MSASPSDTSDAVASPHDVLPPPELIVPARDGRGALYQLHTPMNSTALPWVMSYAFVSDSAEEGVTLFDAGFNTDPATAALTEGLRQLDRKPSDVRRLIVSHAHSDHVGMASWLHEHNPDIELVMQEAEGPFYADTRSHTRQDGDPLYEAWSVTHGLPLTDEGLPVDGRRSDPVRESDFRMRNLPKVDPGRLVADGEEIEFDGWTLVSVWTPGHTPGHLCIYIPDERLTFTGDHILSRITPNISLSPLDTPGRDPLREYLASVKKVAALDTRLALPAHEKRIEDLPARCEYLIEHHDHRAEEVLVGVDGTEGGSTAYEVASRVTWNRPWDTFSLWKRRSAVGETLAHLRYLETEGQTHRVMDNSGDAELTRWVRS